MKFEKFLGCEKATFLSAFNSEDPGVLTISTRLFKSTVPDDFLKGAFNIDQAKLDQLKAGIPENPAPGFDSECLKRCGISPKY